MTNPLFQGMPVAINGMHVYTTTGHWSPRWRIRNNPSCHYRHLPRSWQVFVAFPRDKANVDTRRGTITCHPEFYRALCQELMGREGKALDALEE